MENTDKGTRRKYSKEFKLEASGEWVFPGNGTPREEELVRLRKESASLREDREILRKVVAMFSRPPR